MKQSQPSWIWNFYLAAYFLFSSIHFLYFFFPDSPMRLYYNITVAFDVYFWGIYFLNLTAVALNVLTIVPITLYIYRINFLSKHFWCWFFVIRLALELTGHNYEMNLIKSLANDNAWLGIKIVLNYALFTFPSYAALYTYAFRKTAISASNEIKK